MAEQRLFILGATGNTGAQLVAQGLVRGHRLTAFVRSPHKLAVRHPQLQVVRGDLRQPAALAAAMAGHDAVLSALGPRALEGLRPSELMTHSAGTTVVAMLDSGVKRLAIVSAAVLFPLKGLRYALFRWLLRYHARDLAGMERAVQHSGLEWTIARPPRLVQSAGVAYESQTDRLPGGRFFVSFGALAAFMLDCVEQHTHVGEIVGLARPAR